MPICNPPVKPCATRSTATHCRSCDSSRADRARRYRSRQNLPNRCGVIRFTHRRDRAPTPDRHAACAASHSDGNRRPRPASAPATAADSSKRHPQRSLPAAPRPHGPNPHRVGRPQHPRVQRPQRHPRRARHRRAPISSDSSNRSHSRKGLRPAATTTNGSTGARSVHPAGSARSAPRSS